ncbi:hypothetical protein LHFGNBLO_002528 [Mesorhizobium sp. AR10]|uniref:hypothetical protein n=1 Tax=Mesorhizobium sp. AR10 TaxID=2865839 RepID=UPI00215E9D1D|nr:hypothetical protein [Mesorhizobium sp. AR10]UVK40988.1 hypothetical protein LHFGNBLO_002528 [Mesorhizobium sp. AR10]
MSRRVAAAGALASCLLAGMAMAAAEPLFENSVVSNNIDFIIASDPAVPGCLRDLGQTTQEMAGALDTDELMASDVYTFEVAFADQSQVGLWVHPSVGTREDAEELAALLVGPLGRLPAVMRQRLSHVVVHSGDHTAFAEHLGHFFAVYADNLQKRIATHDLEETVFHESVHATLDAQWAESAEWRQAQAADGAFITAYAAEVPVGEDLAESALFAFTYLRHPERLPPEVVRGVERIMPARLSFFETIFGAPEPNVTGVEPPEDCLAP